MLRRITRGEALAFAVIVCGLTGRAVLDKILAARGDAELVAHWAQLGSVMEIVSGPALAGLGVGISVAVAKSADAAVQRATLRHALGLGLFVSAVVALGLAPFAWLTPLPGAWLAMGALAGWLNVVPGTLGGYWVGLQWRGHMLLLTTGFALAALGAAAFAPTAHLLPILLAAHALPVLALLPFIPRGPLPPAPSLRSYVLPGIVIGILSPASTYAARAIVADAMSWHDAGVLQALWRTTDWVASMAGGVLTILYLPILSAASGTPRFRSVLCRATLVTALPSLAVLALMLAVQGPLLALFYDERFAVPTTAAAIFFAGIAMRIVSWAGLFALYAQGRTLAITVGEFLSLPLFAVLLAMWPRPLTLHAVSLAWLIAFTVYAVFNFVMVLRGARPSASVDRVS